VLETVHMWFGGGHMETSCCHFHNKGLNGVSQ
jgi:hypothetical protein